MTTPLLRVRDLRKEFPVRGPFLGRARSVTAVDGISFELAAGETLALVGESGSGKSTTGRLVARLLDPTSGSVELDGQDVTALSGRALRAFRRDVQIVFQDPYSALNPRHPVGSIIGAGLRIHGGTSRREVRREVQSLLERVGLDPAHHDRYPNEFSGGQRQRIGIARALALRPRLIVCDEPTSALDVSIQAQVLNLLADLQDEFGIAYLFISHDLAVVRHFADRVAVMQDGKLVEVADTESLYATPAHPYTAELLAAVPNLRNPRMGPSGQ